MSQAYTNHSPYFLPWKSDKRTHNSKVLTDLGIFESGSSGQLHTTGSGDGAEVCVLVNWQDYPYRHCTFQTKGLSGRLTTSETPYSCTFPMSKLKGGGLHLTVFFFCFFFYLQLDNHAHFTQWLVRYQWCKGRIRTSLSWTLFFHSSHSYSYFSSCM